VPRYSSDEENVSIRFKNKVTSAERARGKGQGTTKFGDSLKSYRRRETKISPRKGKVRKKTKDCKTWVGTRPKKGGGARKKDQLSINTRLVP